MRHFALLGVLLSLAIFAACGSDDGTGDSPASWSIAVDDEAAALLSVHGTSASDVWMVGANDGDGPVVLRWDGDAWTRHAVSADADLWWVHAVSADSVYLAGSDATIVHYDGHDFARMTTPGLGRDTVFGLWAAGPDDIYAVGARAGRNGFIWHYDGTLWVEVPLPEALPMDDNRDVPGFFKVWGSSPSDVWVVGGNGVVMRGNVVDGFDVVPSQSSDRLLTVHAEGDRVVIAGGSWTGVLLEAEVDALEPVDLGMGPLLQGAFVTAGGDAWAVGGRGTVYHAHGSEWAPVDTDLSLDIESLHAVWVDPDGGVWAVGGNVLSTSLDAGIAIYAGDATPSLTIETPPVIPSTTCPESLVDPVPGGSIARRWNEQLLSSVRRDVPRPTVHARNLFHASIAMWDAWAAYDDTADGYLVRERLDATDTEAAREEAISYAVYRLLTHRYEHAVGGAVSTACYDDFMTALGYDLGEDTTIGDTPAALGNRIAATIIDAYADDGSNEQNNYVDPDDWTPDNPRLVVDLPGASVDVPTRWQQLVIAEAVTQNGLPEGSGVRDVVGAHWGSVTPFALTGPQPYHDIGAPPTVLDDALVDAAVEVVRHTAELDVDGVTMDVSPGAYGNNPLGTNDGTGHDLNPTTGAAYEPTMVPRGDFTRALAEFWADGPHSETPPGHWNTLANNVASHPDFERRLFGAGEPLSPLAWDVHVYLALNGAVHDAAVAAWGLKRHYESARPITLIRYLGGLGQRTDPSGPSYHAEGIPLVDGLIEVITEESAAVGARHAHLARYVGEVAVRSWRGEPGDRETEFGGIDWIRAVEWLPYQRRTFVTPAFPGYVSGHSAFSRSAAEVLTILTGDAYFPGGMGGYTLEPGYLVFEFGPTTTVPLQWATYYDASDQAGQSRLWGGIHVRQDDFDGRMIGALVGADAVDLARGYYDGSAVP